MENEVILGDVLVDCADAAGLQDFYAALLGWQKTEMYGSPAVKSKTGVVFLFVQEEDYVPPVWPEVPGAQQKQLHFDFQVPNIPTAVAKAERLGARKTEAQFGGEWWTTMLDPAGHPFCLCGQE